MERLALNSQRSARRSRSHDLPVLCLSRWKDRHRARRQFGARPAMLSLVLLHHFQFSAPAFRLQPSFPPSGPPPFSPLSLLLSACLLFSVSRPFSASLPPFPLPLLCLLAFPISLLSLFACPLLSALLHLHHR